MAFDAWIKVPRDRSDEVWDRFDEAFQFRPSVHSENWPSFREPTPFATWDIRDLLEQFMPWRDVRASQYNLALLESLRACVPKEEPVMALDWQHSVYEFYPHRFQGAHDPANWAIPALPSAEYHIFVTEDHRLGSLGHPWEGTVCVFGDGFIDEYFRHTPLKPDKIIRRQGP